MQPQGNKWSLSFLIIGNTSEKPKECKQPGEEVFKKKKVTVRDSIGQWNLCGKARIYLEKGMETAFIGRLRIIKASDNGPD